MKNKFIIASVLSAFALTGIVYGQSGVSGSGNMGVSATIDGSILLTFAQATGGLAVTTPGSSGSLPFGTVKMYSGSVPTGVTQTLTGTTSFTLSTPFNVRVDLANDTSSTCVLSALLSTAEAGTKVWLLGGTDISAGITPTVLTSTCAYATAVPYTLQVTVLASDVTGAITNSIAFTAVSN